MEVPPGIHQDGEQDRPGHDEQNPQEGEVEGGHSGHGPIFSASRQGRHKSSPLKVLLT